MTRFWNCIAIWPSLHKPVRISGSSHGSSSNRHCIDSIANTYPDQVQISRAGPNCCNMQPYAHNDIQTHTYTYTRTNIIYTYMYTPYTYIYTSIYIHTHNKHIHHTYPYTTHTKYIHTNTYPCTPK